MNIFLDEHQAFLKALVHHQIDFLLVGGYAVIHYGYRRTTADMDLWVKPSNDNKEKLVKMLQLLNYHKEDIEVLKTMDFREHLTFSMGEEPAIIDFLTHINMVNWEEADLQKSIADIDGIKVPVIHFNHLILSKINNNRTKDKLDIEELQKIRHKNLP